MKTIDTTKKDVDICTEKIREVLKEYNCFVLLDEEIGMIIVDIDTREFRYIRE